MAGEIKSAFQDKAFSAFWNERAGDYGEPYKRFVTGPVLMHLAGDLSGRNVLELGAGNGYLAKPLLDRGVAQLTLLDISEHNLEHARQKCSDARITYLAHDATTPWPVQDASLDVVHSEMMLNEVADIHTPISETYRTLKDKGVFVFSVTHPAWDLFVFAQSLAGKAMNKISGLGSYFRRGMATFKFGVESKGRPDLDEKYEGDFAVEHYQRPISDYFTALRDAGFTVTDFVEPEITEELLKEAPRFAEYQHHPVGLIFKAVKM